MRQPRVTGLQLVDSGLTGQVPAGLAGLDGLQALDLAWNQLGGEIPDSLGRLDGLQKLRLEGNQAVGMFARRHGVYSKTAI